jgi:hypothetical protein
MELRLIRIIIKKDLLPVILYGTPDEWVKIDNFYQNNKCYHIFAKGPSGEEAYDVHGVIFEDSEGFRFVNSNSYTPVTFPKEILYDNDRKSY